MSPIRTHVFVADPELCTDPAGRRFGRCCPLPEDNQCHRVAERPPDDRSDDVLGERRRE
jgi:hypothetical protein